MRWDVGRLVGLSDSKDLLFDQFFCKSYEFFDLFLSEYPFPGDFPRLRIEPCSNSVPESVRFNIQNFTDVDCHVIIFFIKTEFV